MGRGKLSREGRLQRRQQIVDYIREHGTVKGSDICRDLEMSRSSLSDDIRSINIGGEIILSPKKGTYTLNEKSGNRISPYSKIDRKSVRRWMILLSLFKNDRTFNEIYNYLADRGISNTESVLYADLSEMQKAGWVTRVSVGRNIYYHGESLYETDEREVSRYAQYKRKGNARISIAATDRIDLKIKHSFPEYEQSTESDVRRSGKSNLLTDEQFRRLHEFEQYHYRERELRIHYMTNAGAVVFRDIRIGMIVYVVETTRIYLMGRGSNEQYSIIPLEQIKSVEERERGNYCFHSSEFYQIYREMFQISAEDPMDVRVRFQNYTFIRDKIERLCALRDTAEIVIDGDEIIYTDRIRGEWDFARYLRRFGKSAIVESPTSLREKMMDTSRKVVELYS